MKSFLTLYFTSGVIGGLFQALAGVLLGGAFAAPVVGASAGAFGLVAAFATLYPERPLMLLLFFIIPGVIAYAVDFSNGTIYLPGTRFGKAGIDGSGIKVVKFDRKDFTPELLRHIIRQETGYDLRWGDERLRAVKVQSEEELPVYFAQVRTL